MRLWVHWLRFVGLFFAVILGAIVFSFGVGLAAVALSPDISDVELSNVIRVLGTLVALPVIAWTASRVGMTGWWGLLVLVPFLGAVGIVRIIWRWSGDRDDYALS